MFVNLALALVLALLAVLHVYWAFGGTWASAHTVEEDDEGKPRYAPGFLDTMLVAVALASAALILLVEGGYAFAPPLVRIAVAVIGLVFLARAVGDFRSFGFFKRERGTPFARRDTFVYSPLCLALGLGSLWAALSS